MNKYRLFGMANFLLGVISICLPLFIYAYVVQFRGEKFFMQIMFGIPNQTLFKVLIFNGFLGIIDFSFGLLTFAVTNQQVRKYYMDNVVISITSFLFLSVVITYTYMLVQNIIF